MEDDSPKDSNGKRIPVMLNRQGRRKYSLTSGVVAPEEIEIEFLGETFKERRAQGQILNPKKVWKRYLKSHAK